MGVAIQTLQELFDGCIKLGDLTYKRLEGGVLQLPQEINKMNIIAKNLTGGGVIV